KPSNRPDARWHWLEPPHLIHPGTRPREAKLAVTRLADCSHEELAVLVREYYMAGHMIDRSGIPHVMAELGQDAFGAVAIEEWMGASPVYTKRMQRALGFEGDSVETIFKGTQFDVGAPQQFLDFQY